MEPETSIITTQVCTDDTHDGNINTSYSMNNQNYTFIKDNLRDPINIEELEREVSVPPKFAVGFVLIKPYIDMCIKNVMNHGPGLSYFKFISPHKKRSTSTNNKLNSFNCEYHYISETSFYYKKVLSRVINKEITGEYDWRKNIMIVVRLCDIKGCSESYCKIVKL